MQGWSFEDVLPGFKRMEDWEGSASALARELPNCATSVYHLVGTCRMGVGERAAGLILRN